MGTPCNYDKQLQEIINGNEKEGIKPKLLLHCCCAPCSSYCLESLHAYFEITCFFYNPNITDEEEYVKRYNELAKFLSSAGYGDVKLIDGGYSPDDFFKAVKGNENMPEGGKRCFSCYRLRLEKTAITAEKGGFDYFGTTLTISPHKRADVLNEQGFEIEKEVNVKYLPGDFKKRGGYLRSIELSKQYGLYRQNYCGCIFSKEQARKDGRI